MSAISPGLGVEQSQRVDSDVEGFRVVQVGVVEGTVDGGFGVCRGMRMGGEMGYDRLPGGG